MVAVPITIVLLNKSTVVSDADVTKCALALDTQLNRDFAPLWGVSGHVVRQFAVDNPDYFYVWIMDDSDQAGALGYHEVDNNGNPVGRVFAKTDQQFGLNWTITASHEVLEIAGDPFIFYVVQINSVEMTAMEVCDAVEADALGYSIGGVMVSDFLTPSWFGNPGHKMDFMDKVKKPFALTKGGYMSVWTQRGGWKQRTMRAQAGVHSRYEYGHRHKARQMKSAQDFEIAEENI